VPGEKCVHELVEEEEEERRKTRRRRICSNGAH
jgi:hypothetical protein